MARPQITIEPTTVRAMLAQGMTYEQAASALGVNVATLERRRKQDEKLECACKEGKAQGINAITNVLFETAKGGNVTAMIFYLKNQAGWKDKQEIEGDINHKYYMEGPPKSEDKQSWHDQYSPKDSAQTMQ